jgi:hypothetical protein
MNTNTIITYTNMIHKKLTGDILEAALDVTEKKKKRKKK